MYNGRAYLYKGKYFVVQFHKFVLGKPIAKLYISNIFKEINIKVHKKWKKNQQILKPCFYSI